MEPDQLMLQVRLIAHILADLSWRLKFAGVESVFDVVEPNALLSYYRDHPEATAQVPDWRQCPLDGCIRTRCQNDRSSSFMHVSADRISACSCCSLIGVQLQGFGSLIGAF